MQSSIMQKAIPPLRRASRGSRAIQVIGNPPPNGERATKPAACADQAIIGELGRANLKIAASRLLEQKIPAVLNDDVASPATENSSSV
jgi:hypothetical protein